MTLNEKNREMIEFEMAKFNLGITDSDNIKTLINRLLENGFYLDEFIYIIDNTSSNLEEVIPFLKKR
ncbi:MAG: hypothetical protein H0U57_06810 [Tatlockia sp.]|nr:hypothetical protein [Tatlockia sp.]